MAEKEQWLAQRVAEQIRVHFLKPVRAGGRLMPVRELAEELGVCVKTVRAAQRLLARQGALEIRHGSGVYVAERGHRRRVGIVSELDLLCPRSSSFFAAIVRELKRVFSSQDIKSEFFMGDTQPGMTSEQPSCDRFLEDVRAKRLDGAVIVNAPETLPWRQFIDKAPVPLVGAGTDCYAGIDHRELVRTGLRALAEQGGRKVAVLGWVEGTTGDDFLISSAARFGLELRPEWVRHDLHPQLGGAGWEEWREVWAASPVKPDSLLVTDDTLFSEVVIALAEMGIRIPDQLRIATHANAGDEPKVPFPVTLLTVDPLWCADQLGEMLLRRMKGEPVAPGLRVAPIEVVEAGARLRGEGGRLPRAADLSSVEKVEACEV
jgi:DNA-binding LacI/PurR family transcriptional regulator